MNPDIQITVESGITRVTYRGEVHFEDSTEMLRKVGRIASENQSTKLLFDVREARDRQYHVSAIRHAEQGPALGISPSFRIAVLGAEGDQMLRYVETVAVNRGFLVKAFTDESAALAWLENTP